MKIKNVLNRDCEKLLPRVEEVFLIDDDTLRLIWGEILTETPERVVGIKSFRRNMSSQISFYEMPNGKVCACAYPCSVKVNYDDFNKEMHGVFKHVDRRNFSNNAEAYSVLLYFLKNGYKRKK